MRTPDLAIDATVDNGYISLGFHDSAGGELHYARIVSVDQIKTHQRTLNEDLNAFKRQIGSDLTVESLQTAASALENLARRGETLFYDLFVTDHEALVFCERAQSAVIRSGGIPFIQVTGRPETFLPIECLPLLGGAYDAPIQNVPELIAAARRFVGFGGIVQWVPDTTLDQERCLRGAPRLPVMFLRHAGLEGANDEWMDLHSREEVDADGPWPQPQSPPDDMVPEVARFIWDPARGTDGTPRNAPTEVLHFSCHCRTEGSDANAHSLYLAHNGSTERSVSLGDLKHRIFRLAAKERDPVAGSSRPLVFLNACESAALEVNATNSFPNFFMGLRAKGFIGTHAPIPDATATAFARHFYDELVKQGAPVALAIYRARMHLLEENQNPLGLLYTAYVDPELKMENGA